MRFLSLMPNIEPYLFFNGRCEEALEFYKTALGAEVLAVMRYRESPEPMPEEMVPPGWEDKVMHALFTIGESKVMACDSSSATAKYDGFSLCLNVAEEATARQAFDALTADGGKVDMSLGETFWSPCFGMATDKFGVAWMVCVFKEQ